MWMERKLRSGWSRAPGWFGWPLGLHAYDGNGGFSWLKPHELTHERQAPGFGDAFFLGFDDGYFSGVFASCKTICWYCTVVTTTKRQCSWVNCKRPNRRLVTPNCGLVRESLPNPLNSGLRNIVLCLAPKWWFGKRNPLISGKCWWNIIGPPEQIRTRKKSRVRKNAKTHSTKHSWFRA